MTVHPVSYGAALRCAAVVPMGSYDEETVLAFVSDLFRRDYNDVELSLIHI